MTAIAARTCRAARARVAAGKKAAAGARASRQAPAMRIFAWRRSRPPGPRAGLGDVHREQPGDQQRAEDRRMQGGPGADLQPQQCRAADLLPGQQPHEAQRVRATRSRCGQEETPPPARARLGAPGAATRRRRSRRPPSAEPPASRPQQRGRRHATATTPSSSAAIRGPAWRSPGHDHGAAGVGGQRRSRGATPSQCTTGTPSSRSANGSHAANIVRSAGHPVGYREGVDQRCGGVQRSARR